MTWFCTPPGKVRLYGEKIATLRARRVAEESADDMEGQDSRDPESTESNARSRSKSDLRTRPRTTVTS